MKLLTPLLATAETAHLSVPAGWVSSVQSKDGCSNGLDLCYTLQGYSPEGNNIPDPRPTELAKCDAQYTLCYETCDLYTLVHEDDASHSSASSRSRPDKAVPWIYTGVGTIYAFCLVV
ncbi:hypothetical protein BO70DRAFT_400472 [Aspergillus heteromorphus CBS 117.55]|uniref:Uncharacterized protein n=1 Tax=Aspergillus heteromorphus CBS 117.55 TaxID=1448321 RepID=A0A317V4W2_9EURO|nr:uncharacterized protein BO70DRAFT_400472 [Aspergillus heteromorphus CBS 117.55]PWY67897.1 hypothetical protein BO70DRAFT_400472 [Aspergillus heteromorphus CBS 117.55]